MVLEMEVNWEPEAEPSFDLYWRHFDISSEDKLFWILPGFHTFHFCKSSAIRKMKKIRFSASFSLLEPRARANFQLPLFGRISSCGGEDQ
jgi:hypothetical protein